jgi:DNA-damage-inducible protein J
MNTMQKTIQVDEKIFLEVNSILNKIGLSYTQAISVFNNMIVQNRGLPFELKLPNQNTLKALNELEAKKGKSFKNINELFDDLES